MCRETGEGIRYDADQDGVFGGPEELEESRERRIRRYAEEAEAHILAHGLQAEGRGRKRAVRRSDGAEFISASEAARATAGVNKPDNVIQAIKRGGKCGGYLWEYVDGMPTGTHLEDDLTPTYAAGPEEEDETLGDEFVALFATLCEALG